MVKKRKQEKKRQVFLEEYFMYCSKSREEIDACVLSFGKCSRVVLINALVMDMLVEQKRG